MRHGGFIAACAVATLMLASPGHAQVVINQQALRQLAGKPVTPAVKPKPKPKPKPIPKPAHQPPHLAPKRAHRPLRTGPLPLPPPPLPPPPAPVPAAATVPVPKPAPAKPIVRTQPAPAPQAVPKPTPQPAPQAAPKSTPTPAPKPQPQPRTIAIGFAGTGAGVSPDAAGRLRAFVAGRARAGTRFVVRAAAPGHANDPSLARRRSLDRGLAVRDILRQSGVAPEQIIVQALGNPPGVPTDRVTVTEIP